MKKRIIVLLTILLFGFNLKIVNAAIKINNDEISIGVNSSYTLSTSGSETSNIKWSSTDSTIASVGETNGQVTGKKVGTTYITVTDGVNSDTCKINVINNYIAVTDIKTARGSVTLVLNETKNIGASVLPSNATNKSIKYSSNNPNIVSVDGSGNIKGLAVGSTYIFISAESKSISYKVTVVDNIKLEGISIDKTKEIKEGASDKLTVTYNPNNATNKAVSWKSSNTGIVTVDSNGNIKGIAPGSATITVTSNDGSHVATSKITVTAIDKTLKSISLNKKELKLDSGKTETLTVTYNPSNTDTKNVTWKSSDTEVATVDAAGKVTALKPGTAEIKATSEVGNYEATCKVTVTALPIKSIKFALEEQEMYLGDTKTLETIAEPTYSVITEPVWTSSDIGVISISETGELTALALGTATITVSDKDGKITASTKVTVVNRPPEKLIITIEGYDINFKEEVTDYTLMIGKEDSLNIKTNLDPSNVVIGGNRDLQNGSIITITVNNNGTKQQYVLNIKKKATYTLYFIIIISVLLIANIIRIIIKNKKNKLD